MADLEPTFLKRITAEPEVPLHRLIYADWLEERGDPRGELLRVQEQLRSIQVPNREALEARMQELLREGVEPLTITRQSYFGAEFVLIFPGEFIMGSPEEEAGRYSDEQQTSVTLTRAFWLSKTLVTRHQWQHVMVSSTIDPNGDRWPISDITWEQAGEFCRRVNRRELMVTEEPPEWELSLPAEAQWEYACRAGTTTRFSYGEDTDLVEQPEYSWATEEEEEVYRYQVQQKRPNPWGLYDLHGNLWEWCQDAWADRLPGGVDPLVIGHDLDRVIRGGSMKNRRLLCRSGLRSMNGAEQEFEYVGFRPAMVRCPTPEAYSSET